MRWGEFMKVFGRSLIMVRVLIHILLIIYKYFNRLVFRNPHEKIREAKT